MTATPQQSGVHQLAPLLRRLTGDEPRTSVSLASVAKHELSAESTLDVIWVLYDRVLRVDPAQPDADGRDRFLVSKGHGPHAYYVVLAAKGFFPLSWLDDLAGPASPLGHHPDRTLIPGVEISSGSHGHGHGHGHGLGVGVAVGLRAQGLLDPRVYVLLGDGELDEGANHEAIAYAGAAGIDSLTAIVIDNRSATHRQDLAGVFTVHGWSAVSAASHDHDGLERALRGHTAGSPHVVVADGGDR